MPTASLPTGRVTFVFSDIEGSTRRWDRAPDAMRGALGEHDRLFRDCVEAHEGVVFKTIGDAICSAFSRPADAVAAAIDVQRALTKHEWPAETGQLRVRIGVHTGDAISANGDYFGPTLNRVARIMSVGHGGQILVSGTTADRLRDALPDIRLRDLGVHRLKDLTTPEEIYQIVARGLPDDFPPLSTLDALPNNLPTHISNFIGREEELSQLREMLGKDRLITVTGPGGIGKTRLALQTAADAIGDFRDGAWFVNLAEIARPDHVPQKIATALHVRSMPGETIEASIFDDLSGKAALVILDNVELLLDQTSTFVRGLLAACLRVSVLVTSREPLHLSGEQVLRLGPMALAPPGLSLADFGAFDATRLFIERAKLVAPNVQFAGADAEAVRSICAKLDGIPLAIEMAAARVGAIGARVLDQRLHSDLRFLASKDPGETARHRTLEAAIDWSYRILRDEERRCFADLSIFDGSFSLDAFEAVVRDETFESKPVALLETLVDKSFVSTRVERGIVRYRVLDPLRDFAREKLPVADLQRLREHHFQFFSEAAANWERERNGDGELAYYENVEREMNDLQNALASGLVKDHLTPAFELLLNLAPFWQLRGHTREARSWFERSLHATGLVEDRLKAAALRKASTFATIDGDYPAARDLSERSRTIFERLGDAGGTAEAVHNLAVIEYHSGNQERAYELYTKALDAFIAAGHKEGTTAALYNLGQISADRNDLSGAKVFFERGMEACADCGQNDRMASFLSALGNIALEQGALSDAADLYGRALQMKRDLGSSVDVAFILNSMSALALRLGENEKALAYARDSLQIALTLNSRVSAIECFESFAVILPKSGKASEAVELFALAESLRKQSKHLHRDARFARELAALRSAVTEDDFAIRVLAARSKDWREIAKSLLAPIVT
ncbi:MAG: adenylate/guanylate cyclase domain-containing protein [Candidatus Baltobacteraceae bacterium]